VRVGQAHLQIEKLPVSATATILVRWSVMSNPLPFRESVECELAAASYSGIQTSISPGLRLSQR
jgi:hypothetical protein